MLLCQLPGVDIHLTVTLPDGTMLQMPAETSLNPLCIELACYLGKNFRGDWCGSEDAWVSAEFQRYASVEEFYAQSNIYLYHLIGYWLEGFKRPTHAWIYQSTAGNIRASILDYGCGIGCDGIAFLNAGFTVAFADLPSRSLEFLRWRLQQRMHLGIHIYPLAPGIEIPRHDIVWCLDVLEHLPAHEHEAFLDHLATLGESVILNLIDDKTADGTVHHPVDIDHLTAHIHQRWDCVYQDYYVRADGGKTRFVWYGDMVPAALAQRPIMLKKGTR